MSLDSFHELLAVGTLSNDLLPLTGSRTPAMSALFPMTTAHRFELRCRQYAFRKPEALQLVLLFAAQLSCLIRKAVQEDQRIRSDRNQGEPST